MPRTSTGAPKPAATRTGAWPPRPPSIRPRRPFRPPAWRRVSAGRREGRRRIPLPPPPAPDAEPTGGIEVDGRSVGHDVDARRRRPPGGAEAPTHAVCAQPAQVIRAGHGKIRALVSLAAGRGRPAAGRTPAGATRIRPDRALDELGTARGGRVRGTMRRPPFSERSNHEPSTRARDPVLVREREPRQSERTSPGCSTTAPWRDREDGDPARSTRDSSTDRRGRSRMNPPGYDPHYHFELAIESGCNAYAAPLGLPRGGRRATTPARFR